MHVCLYMYVCKYSCYSIQKRCGLRSPVKTMHTPPKSEIWHLFQSAVPNIPIYIAIHVCVHIYITIHYVRIYSCGNPSAFKFMRKATGYCYCYYYYYIFFIIAFYYFLNFSITFLFIYLLSLRFVVGNLNAFKFIRKTTAYLYSLFTLFFNFFFFVL